jgi:hypothetical protein
MSPENPPLNTRPGPPTAIVDAVLGNDDVVASEEGIVGSGPNTDVGDHSDKNHVLRVEFAQPQVEVGLEEPGVATLGDPILAVGGSQLLDDLSAPRPLEAMLGSFLELLVVGWVLVAHPHHWCALGAGGVEDPLDGVEQPVTIGKGHGAAGVDEIVEHVDDQHRCAGSFERHLSYHSML